MYHKNNSSEPDYISRMLSQTGYLKKGEARQLGRDIKQHKKQIFDYLVENDGDVRAKVRGDFKRHLSSQDSLDSIILLDSQKEYSKKRRSIRFNLLISPLLGPDFLKRKLKKENYTSLYYHQVIGFAAKNKPHIFRNNGISGLAGKLEQKKQRLVLGNLRFIYKHGWRWYRIIKPSNTDFEDVFQEICVQAPRAVEGYEPSKGAFTTYLSRRIEHVMKNIVPPKDMMVRIPADRITESGRYRKANRRLTKRLGREPTQAEIASWMKISQKRAEQLQEAANQKTHSLSPAPEENPNWEEYLRHLPSKSHTAEEAEKSTDHKQLVNHWLKRLTERERKIICQRYGLYSNKDHTLQEIADQMNVTRERIRQVEQDALRKLRQTADREAMLYKVTFQEL